MKIFYSKSYDKCYKNLKKHSKERENLDKLLNDLQNVVDFDALVVNNYFKVHYNFERLKYQNSNFYSFNLSKSGGVIRLIAQKLDNDIIMVYISFDHYNDFNKGKVIFYE